MTQAIKNTKYVSDPLSYRIGKLSRDKTHQAIMALGYAGAQACGKPKDFIISRINEIANAGGQQAIIDELKAKKIHGATINLIVKWQNDDFVQGANPAK